MNKNIAMVSMVFNYQRWCNLFLNHCILVHHLFSFIHINILFKYSQNSIKPLNSSLHKIFFLQNRTNEICIDYGQKNFFSIILSPQQQLLYIYADKMDRNKTLNGKTLMDNDFVMMFISNSLRKRKYLDQKQNHISTL